MIAGDKIIGAMEQVGIADVWIGKCGSRVVGKVWQEQHERWKRKWQGKAGVSASSPGSDTEVILSAFEYLRGIGGGVLKVGSGDYYIKSGNPIIASNIHLIGAGKGLTNFNIVPDQITYSAGLRCLLRNYDVNNGDSNFVIKDISFKADNSLFENAGFSARAIVFYNPNNVVVEDCDFATMLRPYSGANEAGNLFFIGTKEMSRNVIVSRCDFYNGVTTDADDIDTIFKIDKILNCRIENCFSYGKGVNGSLLSWGHNYNVSGCQQVVISGCYGDGAKIGVWIEASGGIVSKNTVKIVDSWFDSVKTRGIGVAPVVSEDTCTVVSGCTCTNCGTNGILCQKGYSAVIACKVINHALLTSIKTAGIVAQRVIACEVNSVSNVSQTGIIPYEAAIANTIQTYYAAMDLVNLHDVRIIANTFKKGADYGLSGVLNLRECNNFIIKDNVFYDSYIRIVFDGTNGDGHQIINNQFNNSGTTASDIQYANTIPVKLWIEGNKLYNGIQAALVNGKNVIINNINFPTKNFSASGLSVALGSNEYGTPTVYTPPAGFISDFNLILHITAAAGDTVYAKVTTVYENVGETTGIVKEVDNSAGTAAVSQDFVLDTIDKQQLWVNNDRLLQIKVYGDSVNGDTGSSVTFDVFGSS